MTNILFRAAVEAAHAIAARVQRQRSEDPDLNDAGEALRFVSAITRIDLAFASERSTDSNHDNDALMMDTALILSKKLQRAPRHCKR